MGLQQQHLLQIPGPKPDGDLQLLVGKSNLGISRKYLPRYQMEKDTSVFNWNKLSIAKNKLGINRNNPRISGNQLGITENNSGIT